MEHGNDDSHAGHHGPGGELLPGDETAHQHAFIVLGRQTVFLCHMTMFDWEVHSYQLILRVTLPEDVKRQYLARLDRPQAPQGAAWPGTMFLGNTAGDVFGLPELLTGDKRAFRADMFQGIPPRKKADGWPWRKTDHPHYRVAADFPVSVDRVVYARHFDFGLKHPDFLTYILFGEGEEAHLHSYQTKDPDFDHMLTLKARPDWLPERKLRASAHVTFDKAQRPYNSPVYCDDPLTDGHYHVRYQGQGRRYPIHIDKTWWFATAVVNHVDPCPKEPDTKGDPHAGHH